MGSPLHKDEVIDLATSLIQSTAHEERVRKRKAEFCREGISEELLGEGWYSGLCIVIAIGSKA